MINMKAITRLVVGADYVDYLNQSNWEFENPNTKKKIPTPPIKLGQKSSVLTTMRSLSKKLKKPIPIFITKDGKRKYIGEVTPEGWSNK